VIAVAVGIGFFLLSLAIGSPVSEGFLFAIGVTVALVPEGLLPTVTLALALGGQRMARCNALVRRLDAVETLGSTTFICTDKTGTLTRNEMSVVSAWSSAGLVTIDGVSYEPTATIEGEADAVANLTRCAAVARRSSTGVATPTGPGEWNLAGDPMEAAIDALWQRCGAPELAPVVRRLPFDGRRLRSSALTASELCVKGAPDAVLSRCKYSAATQEALHVMASGGLRVLAVATRPARPTDATQPADEIERDLELVGLLGFRDPPRQGVADAIARCRKAGVRVGMVTGDHPETARAIAAQTGLLNSTGRVLQGTDLPEDEQVLGALVDVDGVVVARVTPADKLRIARALRARGHVVAMTGDGVNDGPALAEANIGIAMGRIGTDVAREAADLVLLDDDFATIVVAVEQGRATFANIRRFLTYHLTDNVAELTPFAIWALSGGRFPLAIGVLQVLFLDIGTDLLPALALGAEEASPHVLDRPLSGRHLLDRGVLIRAFGVLGPTEAAFEMTAFLTACWVAGWRPGDSFPTDSALAAASGAAFSAVVFGQLANAFACRSTLSPPWKIPRPTNWLLIGAVAVELCLLACFLYIEPLADLLGQAPPPPLAFAVAVSTAFAVVAADLAYKHFRTRTPQAPSPVSPAA